MIPFADDTPRNSFPFVTVGLIALNVLMFLYQLLLQSSGQLETFILQAALVPIEVTNGLDLESSFDFFTSMFMHGDFLHLGGNMLYLWIFGDNVEDTLGHGLFLVFYLGCGIFADFAHILTNFNSTIPTLGASGAVAGVLGAYMVIHPQARVRTLIFMFRFARVVTLSALWLLGFWFVLQLIPGLLNLGSASVGIAYWAHIGGFLAGGVAMAGFATLTGIPIFPRQRF